jgi:hypothetical protein
LLYLTLSQSLYPLNPLILSEEGEKNRKMGEAKPLPDSPKNRREEAFSDLIGVFERLPQPPKTGCLRGVIANLYFSSPSPRMERGTGGEVEVSN